MHALFHAQVPMRAYITKLFSHQPKYLPLTAHGPLSPNFQFSIWEATLSQPDTLEIKSFPLYPGYGFCLRYSGEKHTQLLFGHQDLQ